MSATVVLERSLIYTYTQNQYQNILTHLALALGWASHQEEAVGAMLSTHPSVNNCSNKMAQEIEFRSCLNMRDITMLG